MDLIRHLLFEMDYGSLIDKDKYDEMDGPDQRLYKYTADGFTTLSSRDFNALMERYPFEGGTLYRGLYFSEVETFEAFMENVSDGAITTSEQSSWSQSRSTAKDFAMTTKTYFPTPEVIKAERDRGESGDHMNGQGGGVIIKIEHAPAGIGIDIDKTDYAKESEVLLPAGTYAVTVDQVLRPFRVSHSTVDKAREMLNDIRQFNETGEGDEKQLAKYATYLEKSFLSKLEDVEVDELLKFQYRKALDLTPEKFAELSVNIDTSRAAWRSGKELHVSVNPHYDFDLYELASGEMQDQIMAQMTALSRHAEDELADIKNVDEFSDINIRGFTELAQFDPDGVDAATGALKKSLSAAYQKLNSREYNRTLKDMNAIRDHAKKIGSIVSAIAKLG